MHLVEQVLPHVRYRQWTLSFPHRVRWVLLKDVGLLSDVLTVFLRAVFALRRRRARQQGLRGGQAGAVSFIQFFGSALQVTPHFHSLVPDGVFVTREGGVRFEPLPPPTQGSRDSTASSLQAPNCGHVWSPKRRRRERGVRQLPGRSGWCARLWST